MGGVAEVHGEVEMMEVSAEWWCDLDLGQPVVEIERWCTVQYQPGGDPEATKCKVQGTFLTPDLITDFD